MNLDDVQVMYCKRGYQIEREIGVGGYKRVFLANYEGGQIALKVFHQDHNGYHTDLEKRALREIKAMASISSPFVAKILDFSLGDSQYDAFIAEEFIPGESLNDRMKKGKIIQSTAIQMMDNIFQALIECATRNIIHRDIKPANIMLRNDDTAVLTDFGLARAAGDSTITPSGAIVGTLIYAAPECLNYSKTRLHETSDLYSFGIVCYELLTGEHPFVPNLYALERDEIVQRMLYGQPVAAQEKNNHIPQPLSRFVMKLLRRQVADRHSSIQDAYNRFIRIRDNL